MVSLVTLSRPLHLDVDARSPSTKNFSLKQQDPCIKTPLPELEPLKEPLKEPVKSDPRRRNP